MKRLRWRAPSPAMAVAVLGLFLALSGSVVAATKIAKNSIGSQQVKNHSIKGGDLVDDTITGDQVLESSLSTVPRAATANTATAAGAAQTAQTARTADRATTAGSAATADRAGSAANADHATSADQVGGHPASDFASSDAYFSVAVKVPANDQRTLFDHDGLRLVAKCSNKAVAADGSYVNLVTIVAETSSAGATVYGTVNDKLEAGGTQPTTPWSQVTGTSIDPGTEESARSLVRTTGVRGVQVSRIIRPVVASSAGGTTVFLGGGAGIRVAFGGDDGALCSVSAPVMVA